MPPRVSAPPAQQEHRRTGQRQRDEQPHSHGVQDPNSPAASESDWSRLSMTFIVNPTSTSNPTAPAMAAKTMITTEKFTPDSLPV